MRLLFIPALLLLVAAGDPSPVHVDHAWARPTPGGSTNGAAFLTITDTGAPDRLTGVSTPIAERAELHETTMDGTVMKMRALDGVTLTPGAPVVLAPGGKHIMLLGLKAPLLAGDTFPLTLRFEHATQVTVTVTVEVAGSHPAQ